MTGQAQEATVWGSGREPIFQGSQEETKQFVESQSFDEQQGLYIQLDNGTELILEGQHWKEV